jgi:hypothetical protein
MITINFTTLTLLAGTIFGIRWALDDLRSDTYEMPVELPIYEQFQPIEIHDEEAPLKEARPSMPVATLE